MSIKVTVFARDNDKPGNRELVTFLDEHLRALVQAGVRFTFTVTDARLERELAARGIDKLPAVDISRGSSLVSFMTPTEIRSALLKFLGGSGAPGRAAPRRAEDEMSEYYAQEMNFAKYEAEQDDAGDDTKVDLADRAKEEWARRQASFEKKPEPRGRRKTARRDNVRGCDACQDDPCTCRAPAAPAAPAAPVPTRAHTTKPRTPQERLRQAGGDPGNKDDAMLAAMMECSED